MAKMNLKYTLPNGYQIKEVETAKFNKLWDKLGEKIFSDNFDYDRSLINSKADSKKFAKLREQFKKATHEQINLGLYYKNKFVGWSWGYQDTAFTFYMCNSAVLPKHRNKGLYTCLMKEMLSRTISKGYISVYSRHIITNNSILIAKLKAGFKITSFELSEKFGVLVHLTYFPNKTREGILDFRAGLKRPNKKLKKLFKL